MKKLFSVLALTGATTAGAFAACDHSCNDADTLFYVGLGVGGEHGMHKYKLEEVGPQDSNNKFTGDPKGQKNFNKTSAIGQILAGVRSFVDNNWFCGLGIEANLGRSEAEHKEGAIEFVIDLNSQNIYGLYKERLHRICKDYDLEANIQLGYDAGTTRLYGKLGISHTQFKYSFESEGTNYLKTNFYNTSKSTTGFVPGLGIEQKVSQNAWVGLEVSLPIYKNNKITRSVFYKNNPANGEFTPFNGKTKNLKFMVNIKFEL